MSYEIRKNLTGQEVVEKITLRLKGCKYAATLAAHSGYDDGTCRGFSPTCSTSDSYDETVFKELVFCNAVLPVGTVYYGGLQKVSFKRPTINPGETMGGRANLSFTLEDFVHNDMYVVPYEDRRSSKGTFWGKMRARHPHFSGVEVVYSYGLRDSGTFDEPEWVDHYLYVDKSTPNKFSQSFTCLDALSFVDEKKGIMPSQSLGQLATEVTNLSTSFTTSGGPDFEYGAMSEVVYLAIGKEDFLCEVTGAQSFDITQNSIGDTESGTHSIGSSVQKIYRATDIHAIDLIVDAMTNYSQIPTTHIDDYTEPKAATVNKVFSQIHIRKPTKTKTIIDQSIKLAKLKCHSDTKLKKIIIKADDEADIQPVTLTEGDHIIGGSLSFKTHEDKQETHFIHRWGKFPTSDDYKVNFSPINASLMLPQNLGVANEGKEFKNILLGTSTGDMLIGAAYSANRGEKNSKIPEFAIFKMPAKYIGSFGDGAVELGSIVSLTIIDKQDKDGNLLAPLYEIINIQGGISENFEVTARLYQSAVVNSGDVDFTIDTNKVNYDLSTEFAPTEAGNYVIYIAPGVVIGSDDTAIYAFSTGNQAAGVTLTIINRGQFIGMGGAGGDSSDTGLQAQDGSPGGGAINLTVPTVLDNGEGLIYAGGGGSAGEGGFLSNGGGGGQGFGVSLGGYWYAAEERAESGDINGPGGDSSYLDGVVIRSNMGGAFGERGANYVNISLDPNDYYAAIGGAPGLAVNTNGNAFTITSGNNNINIKGEIL